MGSRIESEFIPYEQALKLKALGFNEPCFATWSGETLDMSLQIPSDDYFTKAPTYSQAFRWFRENHQMVFCYEPNLKKDLTYIFFIYIEVTGEKVFVVESKYDEKAELACLDKLIEIVKQ